VINAEPLSTFGWLDYDDRDAQRMREVFAAFDDKDTIDSLGLGVIRDSISDQLFPGISTIQTRARYFFFVPWICRILEEERVPPSGFNARLRELEVALIESLRSVEGPNEGVIGYRARKRLTRLPSTVYWNGLRVFGIRLLPLSTTEYRGLAARLAILRSHVDADDDGAPVSTIRRMWDPELPDAPEGFPHDLMSLTLTHEESEYLAGKIATHCPETMIGELARDLEVGRSASLPWEVVLPGAPIRLAEVLGHGRNFSDLMQGAQALYNLLLARHAEAQLARDTVELQQSLVEELDEWAALIEDRRSELSAWIASDEFWFAIERMTRVPSPTRRFVTSWAVLALSKPIDIASSPEAEALVTEREFRLKGKLARLTEARALENWNGDPFSPGQMIFRWNNARRILDDIEDHADE
jgi:hypothetical protein